MNLNWKWFGSCIGMIRSSVLIRLINCDFLFFMFETEKKMTTQVYLQTYNKDVFKKKV